MYKYRSIVIYAAVFSLSGCSSTPEDRSNEYLEKVAQMSNDELCFQLAAHSSLDKWQIIRSKEVNRRSEESGKKICKEWLEAAKNAESNGASGFIAPSYYSPDPLVIRERVVVPSATRPSLYDQAYPYAREQSYSQSIIQNSSSPRTAPAVRSAVPNY